MRALGTGYPFATNPFARGGGLEFIVENAICHRVSAGRIPTSFPLNGNLFRSREINREFEEGDFEQRMIYKLLHVSRVLNSFI